MQQLLVRPENMKRIDSPALAQAYIDEQVAAIQQQVGDGKVLLALSGGVDSSVVAALLIKAIGDRLVAVHVNHGLLRKGEPEQVIEVFRNQMHANLIYVDAVDRFLDKLAGVKDPETKRKIIGKEFIDVFAEEARKLEGIRFLAQGTIWPDILESEAGIKAHHNAGGLPADLSFELVEPVRILFKDEVRMVGKTLGLPDGMVYRQPFPGPGCFGIHLETPVPDSPAYAGNCDVYRQHDEYNSFSGQRFAVLASSRMLCMMIAASRPQKAIQHPLYSTFSSSCSCISSRLLFFLLMLSLLPEQIV